MATKRRTSKGNTKFGCMLWLAFIVVILVLFVVNWDTIKAVIANTNFSGAKGKPVAETPADPKAGPGTPADKPGAKPTPSPAADKPSATTGPSTDKPSATTSPGPSPAAGPGPSSSAAKPSTSTPAPSSATPAASPSTPKTDKPKAAEYRDAKLFFVVVGDDGGISIKESKRALKATDEPLRDALGALLSGPTSSELGRGLVSLVPAGTKLLSLRIRGSTAELDFSESFLFNKYGPEGLIAQIKQVVYTATAFGTVVDVLFLIDGKPIAYMAEGVRTDKPFRRSSLP